MKKILLAFAVLLHVSAFAQWQEEDPRMLNQYIVLLKPGATPQQLERMFTDIKVVRCLSGRMNIWLLERNTTKAPESFLGALRLHPATLIAQFNHRVEQRNLVPDDPYFNQEWNMLNTGGTGGTAGADIDATDAWDISHSHVTATGDTVVVAIIDNKFDLSHEDLSFFVNYNEIPGNGIDDDGNGYIDDINGWSVPDTSGDINSTGFGAYHSTHTAGIAAAIGNNAKGIAGVCWGAKIMGVNYGTTDEANVVASYEYVRNMRILYNTTFGSKGAFVVATNASFGVGNYGANPADYPLWCAMYDSLGAVGILSAGAAPNADVDVDAVHDVPTECASKWFIGVTNTTSADKKNTGAAYGKISVDLGAPGTGIYSTVPTPTLYQTKTGTSMATPHVTGAVAAMMATACKGFMDAYWEHPDSGALLIKQYLLDGAEWVPALNNKTVTGGRLNLYRAFMNLSRFNCDSCQFDLRIDKTPIACHGANSGAMAAVTLPDNAVNYNILWNTNQHNIEILNLEPGFYTVQVTDTSGCRRTWTAELHDPDSIAINAVNIIPAQGGNPGNVTVNAAAGNDSLYYSLDGVTYQSSPIFTVPTNGSYIVYVKNQRGCVVQQNILVSGVAETNLSGLELQIWPNPANDVLNLRLNTAHAQSIDFKMLDALGEAVSTTRHQLDAGVFTLQLSVAQLAAGFYTLSLSDGVNVAVRRFVVAK